MYSIPVHCDAHGGWGMLHGVVHLEEGRLRLEYQTGDAVLGLLRSASKELVAGFDAVASVRYRSGFLWMSPKIELEFSDFKLVSSVPAGYSGKLALKVPRDSRAMARKFVEELDRELSFRRQLRLEQDIQRLSRADPRPQHDEAAAVEPPAARRPGSSADGAHAVRE